MRGTVIRRKSGSWAIRLSLGRDPQTGKYRQQWLGGFRTKALAERRLTEVLTQLDAGSFAKPTKLTVAAFLDQWLQDYARANLSPRGFERYQGIIAKHFVREFGSIPLAQLRPEHLQRHYTAKLNEGLSPKTVRYHHAVIHVALQTAVKWGMVGRNVADAVEPPKLRPTDMQTWDAHEVARFLAAAKESPYYVLFATAIFTGMRRGELLALRWQDVDLVFSQLSVNRSLHRLKNGSYIFTEPKSAKGRRTIALSPALAVLLRDYRARQEPVQESDLVFSGEKGRPLRPDTVTRAWGLLAEQAGLKRIRLHDARHTHASLMLRQGIHPKIVQERLGHASIQMTLDTYSHVTPGLQQAAAASFDSLVLSEPEREQTDL